MQTCRSNPSFSFPRLFNHSLFSLFPLSPSQRATTQSFFPFSFLFIPLFSSPPLPCQRTLMKLPCSLFRTRCSMYKEGRSSIPSLPPFPCRTAGQAQTETQKALRHRDQPFHTCPQSRPWPGDSSRCLFPASLEDNHGQVTPYGRRQARLGKRKGISPRYSHKQDHQPILEPSRNSPV